MSGTQSTIKETCLIISLWTSVKVIRITYKHIIFKGFNDTINAARELADFCKITPCKINIIEYNSIDGGEFQQADPEKVDAFAEFLERKNLIVNVRRSRGKDIDAACGQLANKNEIAN